MKEEVKALWTRCFNDNDAFIDLYFRLRYKDDINVCIRQDDKVVAALQMIPYPMTYMGEVIPTSYISGACTHPDYRQQGLMRRLLNNTHRRMLQDGALLSTLIPAEDWLFGYYAKSGYAPVFACEEKTMSVEELGTDAPICKVERCEAPDAEYYRYFNARMSERPCCILHTEEDFQVIMEDLKLSGGRLYIAREADRLVGMAFTIAEGDTLRVLECLADSAEVQDALAREAAREQSCSQVRAVAFPPADGRYLGMARVLNVFEMLRFWAQHHPDESRCLLIEGDESIPENNGCYIIESGMCLRGRLPGHSYQRYTIAELTQALLESEGAFMSLMLN